MNATRLLRRLARSEAWLAPHRGGAGFDLFTSGDRRRRPLLRVAAQQVEALLAEGALRKLADGGFALSQAGRARAAREAAAPDETWRVQHNSLADRTVIDQRGRMHVVRGAPAGGAVERLKRISNADGAQFFDHDEIAAALRLAQDWAQGQEGLLRGVDLAAPPRGAVSRGAGAEQARGGAIDARARVDKALAGLAPAAARLVRAACLEETGLEDIERRARWPARSAKLALKFALAQLAQAYRNGGG